VINYRAEDSYYGPEIALNQFASNIKFGEVG